MATIICPRCGGTNKEPTTGCKCRYCNGAKRVDIDLKELEKALGRSPKDNTAGVRGGGGK